MRAFVVLCCLCLTAVVTGWGFSETPEEEKPDTAADDTAPVPEANEEEGSPDYAADDTTSEAQSDMEKPEEHQSEDATDEVVLDEKASNSTNSTSFENLSKEQLCMYQYYNATDSYWMCDGYRKCKVPYPDRHIVANDTSTPKVKAVCKLRACLLRNGYTLDQYET